jgi:hypothetical protein
VAQEGGRAQYDIYEVNRDGTKFSMKVLKHKIIVQNTEEPDSICIEDEYYEPTEDETVGF